MKITRLITLLLATALFARADVLKPSQDSSSLKGKLTPVTGKATTLAVSATRKGYVQFDLTTLPADVVAADIVNARLRVYFPSAKKPGDIAIHTVTAGWIETTTALEPGFSGSSVAMFPAATVVGKKFVEVDVTATVQAWRTIPATNFGFAFVASGFTNVLIGAKEGSGSGYPCELDIEIQRNTTPADGSITAAQLADGSVTATKLGSSLTLGGTTVGTFSGDGSGLTNVTVSPANITGTIPASAVATAPPGMAFIPAGAFTMGNSVAADTDIADSAPVSTTVSAFYMDVNEVTLSQWQTVQQWATLVGGYTDLPAGSGKGLNHPVQTVSWYDCVKWCNARSEREGKTPVYYTNDTQTTVYRTGNVEVTNAQVKWTANGYRLPTEAEWEKAARGGLAGKRFPSGDTISQKQANYNAASGSYTYDQGPNGLNAIGSVGGASPATSPMGSFAANGYSLNDMAGNVFEWCWDWYGTPYAGGTDPHGVASGSLRVLRSGSWTYHAFNARCACRGYSTPPAAYNFIGFRAVLPPGQP